MSIKGKAVAGALWSVSGGIVKNTLSFFIIAILARHLSPDAFGIVAFVWILIELSRGVMLAGLPDALIRQKVWDDTLAATVFWANMAAACGFTLVGCVIGMLLANAGFETLGIILSVLSACFIIDALGAVQFARICHGLEFKDLAGSQLLASGLAGVAAIAAAMAGADVWALAVQRLVSSAVSTTFFWARGGWTPTLTFSVPRLKAVLGYSSQLMGTGLLEQLNGRVTDLVLGVVLGPAGLGLYQVASRLLNLIIQLAIAPLQRVAFAALPKLGDQSVAFAFLRIMRMTSLIALPAFLGSAVIAPELVLICFGETWLRAAPALAVLMLAGWPVMVSYFFAAVLASTGRSGLLLVYTTSLVLSGAVIALLAAPFGVAGAAAGFLARETAASIFALGALKRVVGLNIRQVLGELWRPALCSVIMGGALILLKHSTLEDFSSVARVAILGPTGVVIYTFLVLAVARQVVGQALNDVAAVVHVPILKRLLKLL